MNDHERTRRKPVSVFVVLTGVSGNLGDAVIRRRVLHWSRGMGPIHAYVGRTTEGWVEQLGLRDDEALYAARDRKLWLRRLLVGRGRRALVFDPGEVPLGREHLKSELLFFLITILLRFRGGVIVRPPRAVAHYSAVTGTLHRMSCRLSQTVWWRNVASLERMRCGVLVPDTGFSEPLVPGDERESRTVVVVTLRGKRPLPPPSWFDAVRRFVLARGWTVVVMSQVDEDEDRSRELAELLGDGVATYVPWGSRSDMEQEDAVRSLYQRAAMVISDRLHVLILSALAGAQPVELVESPTVKVAHHFAVVGLGNVSLDAAGRTSDQLVDFLELQRGRGGELSNCLAGARAALEGHVRDLRQTVTGANASDVVDV